MKNFKQYHQKINKLVDKSITASVVKPAAKGIAARTTIKQEKPTSTEMTADDIVAQYVSTIRKQKMELMNAKP